MYLQFNHFSRFAELTHFVSTRQGGVSPVPYNFLNLGLSTQDTKENVMENRRRLAEALKISIESFCIPKQTHSANASIVNELHCRIDNNLHETDAVITQSKQVCLLVQSADCVPLLFYDPSCKAIAAVHAGWRGTVAKIAFHTLKKMIQELGTHPKNVLVGIGPAISVKNYEIGTEVVEQVRSVFGENCLQKNLHTQKFHLDLWQANFEQLIEIGISEENIEIMRLCTFDRQDLFFSARRDKQMTGRFGAGIMLH